VLLILLSLLALFAIVAIVLTKIDFEFLMDIGNVIKYPNKEIKSERIQVNQLETIDNVQSWKTHPFEVGWL